jgi:hypothetical protein
MPEPPSCLDDYPGALFCDGFEDPALAGWMDTSDIGAVDRVIDRVHSGEAAIRAYSLAGGGRGRLLAGFDFTGTELYFRSFVYIEAAQSLTSASFLLAREVGAMADGIALQVGLDGLANLYVGPRGDPYSTLSPSTYLPRDEWVCLEGHVTISDTAGVAEYFVNGALAAQASNVDTQPGSAYGVIVVGVEYTEASQPPVNLWVDDVVVATQRIGCD